MASATLFFALVGCISSAVNAFATTDVALGTLWIVGSALWGMVAYNEVKK